MGYSTTKSKIKVESNKTNNYTDFFYYTFRNILVIGIPLIFISAIVLSSLHSSAIGSNSNSGSDSVTLTLSTSCTLSSSVITPHHASLNGGQYEEGIGNTRINTYCNDNNGYSIYAIGTSNNIDGNTDLVSNLDEHYNIHTGAYANGDNIDTSTPSFWGMKLIPGIGTGSSSELTPPTIMNSYNSYNVVPSSYTLVASRTSGTNMTIDTNITGSYFNTTYNIYASSVQPAGSYEGRVKYLMVHPNNNPHNTIPDIDAAFATTGKQKYQSIDNNYYFTMQDMTSDICNSVTRTGEATTTQLVDIRDNKLYYVTKLKDGHCWMTQNLDFDIDTTRTYTHNDTDLGWNPNSFDSNATWKPDTTNGRYNLPVNGTSVPNWSNQNTYPYSADPGDVYYYTSNSTSDDIKYNSLSECIAANHTEGDCKHYHTGNYYNWTVAIASNDSSSLTTQYTNAPNSICPKGWRLPIATNANQSVYEFGELLYRQSIIATKTSTSYTENGFNNIRKTPLWFVRGGSIYNNALNSSSTYGNYWSSVAISYEGAYRSDFDKNTVTPASVNGGRNAGRTIRCLAR